MVFEMVLGVAVAAGAAVMAAGVESARKNKLLTEKQFVRAFDRYGGRDAAECSFCSRALTPEETRVMYTDSTTGKRLLVCDSTDCILEYSWRDATDAESAHAA